MKVLSGVLLYPSKIGFSEENRVEIATLLIPIVSSLIDLGINCKHSHWSSRGSSGFPGHKLFDKLYESVLGYTDTIAERIGALGCYVPATLSVIPKLTILPEYDIRAVAPVGHYEALSAQFGLLGNYVRETISKLDKLDSVSANLLQDLSANLDKSLFFLEMNLDIVKEV